MFRTWPDASSLVLFDELPSHWQNELDFLRGDFDRIEETLIREANSGSVILPIKKHVFRALAVPPTEAKVLVVGQDPYPNPNHAIGLSFSVPMGTKPLPGSLQNIFKEIATDCGSSSIAKDGDLSPWVEQGVVLLNRTLTVRAGDSGSHQSLGWQKITDEIARKYAQNGAIGLLWGNSAQELRKFFPGNRLVYGVHPSPLSAHRGFIGSKPFSRVNALLEAAGREPIRW
jgi:uracil-DNA glycosylase